MQVLNIMHVNVVCSDLDRSLHFYRDLLGAQVHQFLDEADTDLRPALGIGPDGPEEFRAALLYWGDARGGPYIDLLEWQSLQAGETRQRDPLGAQDLGLVRVSLTVDDLGAFADTLRDNDVPLLAPIHDTRIGPWRLRILVSRDPDGTLVQLVDFPEGTRRRRDE